MAYAMDAFTGTPEEECRSNTSSESEPTGPVVSKQPWLRPGTKTLGDECYDLMAHVALSNYDLKRKYTIRLTLQNKATEVWPALGVTVKMYGSVTYGLSLPTSDLDVVIECCSPTAESLEVFVRSLYRIGFTLIDGIQNGGTDAFLKMRFHESNLNVNITLTTGTSPVRTASKFVKNRLFQYPAAQPVLIVLRIMLSQCSLMDVPNGGISSYTLIIMMFHMINTVANVNTADPGSLLLAFLKYYGEFNFAEETISATSRVQGRMHRGSMMSVCDPLRPDNNVAEGCTIIGRFQPMLRCCYSYLARFEDGSAGDLEDKGHTPLSTIISSKLLRTTMNVGTPPTQPAVTAPATPVLDSPPDQYL